MATLAPDQVRSLDQTRQRLLALHTSLVALRSELTTQNQLPPWSSLKTHANLVSNNLQTIVTQLSEHRDAFQSTLAYPLPQFPGKERSFILETLLRTKLEPSVEEWVEEGEKLSAQQHKGKYRGLSKEDRDSLWQWAPGAANKEARKQKWGADFTLEEKEQGTEGIITGLRRELVEPPDDDDDGEDDVDEDDEEEYEASDHEDEDSDKMDVETELTKAEGGGSGAGGSGTDDRSGPSISASQMPLQTIHKFMTTGR